MGKVIQFLPKSVQEHIRELEEKVEWLEQAAVDDFWHHIEREKILKHLEAENRHLRRALAALKGANTDDNRS